MILTDKDIQGYLFTGKIKLSPLDLSLLNPTSMDFRLGNKVTTVIPTHKKGYIIDPLDKETFTNHTFDCPPGGYRLSANSTVCFSMFEELTLPANISAKISGKSSLARLGIDCCSPGGWIDSGWSGNITLEITNLRSDCAVLLTPEMKIGQLIFYEHEEVENGYDVKGRYFGQQAGQGSKGI